VAKVILHNYLHPPTNNANADVKLKPNGNHRGSNRELRKRKEIYHIA
jgi:hypothetical protein